MHPYPHYKPSNIDWIGEIPEHWEVKKIKYNTYVKARVGWHGLKSDEFFFGENGAFCITGTDFEAGKINWETCYKVSEERYEEDPFIQLKERDLLVTKDGTIGKVGIVRSLVGKATLNSGVFIVRPVNEDYLADYLYWLIISDVFKGFVDYTSKGSTIIHLYQDTFINWGIPIPPLPEQRAIAAYLDTKTAQIDTLIRQKQRLIELLREERAALINEAVTKGIDPKARMKDSGVEWIGEVPEGWEVKKLKFLGIIKYGLGQPPKQKQDGLPLIRATNVSRGRIYEHDMIFVDPDDVPFERDPVLREHDIIVVRSGAYTADSAIIPKKYEGAITGYDMVIRIQNANPKFVAFGLLSDYILNRQLIPESQRAAQPHLNREELGETLIIMPETAQKEEMIVNFIEHHTTQTDATILRIGKEIELLQEYRTALISETVTGKICVLD